MIHMKHKRLFPAAVCGSLSIILIVLVRCVDVAPIGAEATNIGLSHLNGFVFKLFGVILISNKKLK